MGETETISQINGETNVPKFEIDVDSDGTETIPQNETNLANDDNFDSRAKSISLPSTNSTTSITTTTTRKSTTTTKTTTKTTRRTTTRRTTTTTRRITTRRTTTTTQMTTTTARTTTTSTSSSPSTLEPGVSVSLKSCGASIKPYATVLCILFYFQCIISFA